MPKKPLADRGDEPFVFVSYAHADAELAYPLIAGLRERGVRVWYDEGMDAGDLWDEVIPDHVERCAAMLCLVSTRFTDSNNCLDEIHYAKEQKKELMILHLEDEALPRSFQFRYGRLHAIKRSDYPTLGGLLDKLLEHPKLRCCLGEGKGTSPEVRSEEIYQRGKACYEAGAYNEAVKWYREAASLGHAGAMYDLGICCANGRGVALSHEEAVTWYRRAADKGNTKAMYNLGICYANGWGVALSHEEAVTWYRRAADKGNATAMWNLGICYFYGWGVPRIDTEAVKWCRLAADKGNAAAMRDLGNCYRYGWGVAMDQEQADYWSNKAEQAEAEASK